MTILGCPSLRNLFQERTKPEWRSGQREKTAAMQVPMTQVRDEARWGFSNVKIQLEEHLTAQDVHCLLERLQGVLYSGA